MKSNTESPNIFWIHCNHCFANYINKDRGMYILACYHIACDKCARTVTSERVECPICKKALSKKLINNKLPTKVKEFFHPRPWMLTYQKSFAIVKFQTKQRDHFLKGCKKLVAYNKTLEKRRDSLKEECRKLYASKIKVKSERKSLEAKIKKFLQKEKNNPKTLEKSTSSASNQSIELPGTSSHCGRKIHPTYNGHDSNYTIDFASESHLSKSFVL